MRIQNMFYDDINRKINGVIKVDQESTEIMKQEVSEYVITSELKKHFIAFFNHYESTFNQPSDEVGVWISGFFGSGKSHFLKMLSYILQNREIDGKTTVKRFENKFEDDMLTYSVIDKCTKTPADTILFNIDIEGSNIKDKTAVLKVFTKMFYNHLGFYGENLKVAKLEQYIDRKGKTTEFREVFEEKNGDSWIDSRDTFDFCEDEIVETLTEVLGMSEVAARNWFDGTEEIEISIASLVKEIKEYVDSKPKDYRLLFMVDEVGQYVGGDTNLLLNLQSLVEKIGSECNGKVWVICTGQEAIDEIIKTRTDEFSRIQARFNTRLSLSSSSADEVIQKRILRKNDEAKKFLENTFEEKKNEMANLFKFRDAQADIKGFKTSNDFYVNFPFVPYQFKLMQKVFTEIRKHGNTGKHLSGGERSMLSGFQECAQKVQDKDENTIVPFYMFYDTVHSFLDGSIRRVIDRCERAIVDGHGLIEGDQNVLKLLYMIRYVDDIPAKLDNIIILMAENVKVDKLEQRKKIEGSLNRLIKENYIARTGDNYNFLTDVEQDIEREIKNESVEPSEVTAAVSELIFTKIYTVKKYSYKNKYDFLFDKRVDETYVGNASNDMELRILTMATSPIDKTEIKLIAMSEGKVICVLDDTEYYNYLETAMKIRKYARKKNVSQLQKNMQDIIRGKQEDAERFEENALIQLEEAFKNADFYVDKYKVKVSGGTAKAKVDSAFDNLVLGVYSQLDLIEESAQSDQDILDLLEGKKEGFTEINKRAVEEVERYLIANLQQNLPTNMADVQKRFQSAPYGWRDIDIAYVTARLIYNQKVTLKYNGETLRSDERRLPDLLRKKSEIGKVKIKKREAISLKDSKEVREFLRDFFGMMDIPSDDDGLTACIVRKFEELKETYERFQKKYVNNNYPGKKHVVNGINVIEELLRAKSDNIALAKKLISMQDDLEDMQEDMEDVEGFFKTQIDTFDKAVELEKELTHDMDHIEDTETNEALNKIRLIVKVKATKDNFDYKDIPSLNSLMKIVREGHNKVLEEKKESSLEIIRMCLEEIHTQGETESGSTSIVESADRFFNDKKETIRNAKTITVLESYTPSFWKRKDDAIKDIENLKQARELEKQRLMDEKNKVEAPAEKKTVVKKVIKKVPRQILFSAKKLETEEDVKNYLKQIETKILENMKDCDGIEIN